MPVMLLAMLVAAQEPLPPYAPGDEPPPEAPVTTEKPRVTTEKVPDLPPVERVRIAPMIGTLAGAPLWIPVLGVCGVGCVLSALVYPVSLGDPTTMPAGGPVRQWVYFWTFGCLVGYAGTALALAASVVVPLAGAVGRAAGILVAGKTGLRHMLASSALVAASAVPSVLLIAAGIVASFAMTTGYAFVFPAAPTNNARIWWLGARTVAMAGVAAVLCGVVGAVVMPVVTAVLVDLLPWERM